MSINKEEAAFMIGAINLWVNTVFEVIDIVEDKQQICTLLQRCKYAKTLLNKLKEV
mgnify:CR=1 FL=1